MGNAMYNNQKKFWIYFSIGGLIVSLISLFFPIITYTNQIGTVTRFNIFHLLGGGFAGIVQEEYIGKSMVVISQNAFDRIVAAVGVIGAVSIITSFIGIRSMSKQYESQWPFRMTLCGLIGTTIPAILLMIAVLLSPNYYLGDISLGMYVIVTPIAMIASCLAVVKRHQMTRLELELQKEASMYIRVAGDLPTQQ